MPPLNKSQRPKYVAPVSVAWLDPFWACVRTRRNYEDVYNDPGAPLTRRTKWGTYVLAKLEGKRQLLMEGIGASEEGNKPFLRCAPIIGLPPSPHSLWRVQFGVMHTPPRERFPCGAPVAAHSLRVVRSRWHARPLPLAAVPLSCWWCYVPSSAHLLNC